MTEKQLAEGLDSVEGGGSEPPEVAARRTQWEFKILATMYLGYAAFMLCRNTLIAVSPAMIQYPTLGLDKAGFGKLMSLATAGAITGKFFTGVGADVLGGRLMFLLALGLTAGSNIVFAMVSTVGLFMVLNFLGQFFKAGGWPAMTKVVGDWYPPSKYGRVWGIISTSSRVGTIAAGLVLGYLTLRVSWRTAFFLSGMLTLLMVGGCAVTLKNRPEDVGIPPLPREETSLPGETADHPLDGTSLATALQAILWSPRVWLICWGMAFLTAMMDFIIFVPVYLQETMKIAPGKASMAASAFPIGAFVSLLASGFLYDRLSKRQKTLLLGGLLVVSVLCIVGLRALPGLDVTPGTRLALGMATVFLFGVAISPAYYLPMSIFSISFGGPHSGFLVAMIDIFGYLGAFLWTYFGGTLAQDHGWDFYLLVLSGLCAVCTILMTLFLFLDEQDEVLPSA
jgi:sugar phosphate permease